MDAAFISFSLVYYAFCDSNIYFNISYLTYGIDLHLNKGYLCHYFVHIQVRT